MERRIMSEDKPTWIGPWCSHLDGKYYRQCFSETSLKFWYEVVDMEELWNKGLGYSDLPTEFCELSDTEE